MHQNLTLEKFQNIYFAGSIILVNRLSNVYLFLLRLNMGILGMPSTLHLGLRLGGNGVGGAGEGTKGIQSPVYAHITLTTPPGWTEEDTSLLYPLIVQM